jgi:hypothetical protein
LLRRRSQRAKDKANRVAPVVSDPNGVSPSAVGNRSEFILRLLIAHDDQHAAKRNGPLFYGSENGPTVNCSVSTRRNRRRRLRRCSHGRNVFSLRSYGLRRSLRAQRGTSDTKQSELQSDRDRDARHTSPRRRRPPAAGLRRFAKNQSSTHRPLSQPASVKHDQFCARLAHGGLNHNVVLGRNSTCPVTALSLTTPAVSRDFISYFFCSLNTPSLWHADRVSVAALFHLCHPQLARAGSASSIRCCPPNIASVTIDHDELCDLPVGRRVA